MFWNPRLRRTRNVGNLRRANYKSGNVQGHWKEESLETCKNFKQTCKMTVSLCDCFTASILSCQTESNPRSWCSLLQTEQALKVFQIVKYDYPAPPEVSEPECTAPQSATKQEQNHIVTGANCSAKAYKAILAAKYFSGNASVAATATLGLIQALPFLLFPLPHFTERKPQTCNEPEKTMVKWSASGRHLHAASKAHSPWSTPQCRSGMQDEANHYAGHYQSAVRASSSLLINKPSNFCSCSACKAG